MEYTTLRGTGMTVSKICLGCLSFGSSEWRDWVLDQEESTKLIDRAIELGINFFDTANLYSAGESERVVGNALAEYNRDWTVLATKVYFQYNDENPNSGGLSRKTIDQELDNSLDRLGMDTVDLYQIHRWDERTPITETLRALDDAVRQGRTRYIGASSMWAWQFAEALHTSRNLGLEQFATMQPQYNLVYREEEREMLPLCAREDVGVLPWSPLARGYLARPHAEMDATSRAAAEKEGQAGTSMYDLPYREGGGLEVNERVAELSAEYDATMAQISLAWLLAKDWVDVPVVGTTSIEHLEEAVEAVDIDLTASDVEWLEEPYATVEPAGFFESFN